MKNGKRMKIIFVTVSILGFVTAAIIFAKYGFSQMMVMEDTEMEGNQMMLAADAGKMVKMTDNQEYVENQVVAVAESKREAKKIAKQIGGELLSYDNQVAVIQIGGTVEEMMQQQEEDSTLPRVYPNYQGYQNYTN